MSLVIIKPNIESGGCYPPLLLVFCILTVGLFYSPGLSGPFVFDDFAPTNLPALGAYNGIHDWQTLRLYLAQAHAGPTGRPISMLSFLLNATNWPADPFPFKLTNLLLHLLNAVLLYGVLIRLLRFRYDPGPATWIALLTAAWWLIHPMWVSTVLYVVQRMAMLPVTFLLLAFLAYLHGRTALPSRTGYLWMSGAILIGTLLATLSKENGALLPLLLLITEVVWIQPHTKNRPDKRWLGIILGLPSLAITGYLLSKIPNAENAYAIRPFNLMERLLTESRILCEYLRHLFFPRLLGSGLFHDGYLVSKGLLNPPTTLLALLVISLLLGSAWWLRHRQPLYSLAVLFYFAGHLVESTVVPLELYYEHRNYLPALFLFLPAAAAIVWLQRSHRSFTLLPIGILSLLSFITFQRAQTWQTEYRLLTTWAVENPESVRAQIYGALAFQNQGQHSTAFRLLLQAAKYHPQSLSLQLYTFSYECTFGLDARPRLRRIQQILKSRPFDFHDYEMFANMMRNIHQRRCQNIPPHTVFRLLDQLEANPAFRRHPRAKRKTAHWRGEFLLAEGLAGQALQAFQQSQHYLPDLDAGMLQVAMLASTGHYNQALEHLNRLEQIHLQRKGIQSGMDYDSEMARIRKQLLKDLSQ